MRNSWPMICSALLPRPLQQAQVACLDSYAAALRIPEARRLLLPRPLQHINMPTSCSSTEGVAVQGPRAGCWWAHCSSASWPNRAALLHTHPSYWFSAWVMSRRVLPVYAYALTIPP
jgi:hypothetical protein